MVSASGLDLARSSDQWARRGVGVRQAEARGAAVGAAGLTLPRASAVGAGSPPPARWPAGRGAPRRSAGACRGGLRSAGRRHLRRGRGQHVPGGGAPERREVRGWCVRTTSRASLRMTGASCADAQVGRLRGRAGRLHDRGVLRRGFDGAPAQARRPGSASDSRVGGWLMLTSGTSNPAVWRVGRRGAGVARPGRDGLTERMAVGVGGGWFNGENGFLEAVLGAPFSTRRLRGAPAGEQLGCFVLGDAAAGRGHGDLRPARSRVVGTDSPCTLERLCGARSHPPGAIYDQLCREAVRPRRGQRGRSGSCQQSSIPPQAPAKRVSCCEW
jgi:hypothetical protein